MKVHNLENTAKYLILIHAIISFIMIFVSAFDTMSLLQTIFWIISFLVCIIVIIALFIKKK